MWMTELLLEAWRVRWAVIYVVITNLMLRSTTVMSLLSPPSAKWVRNRYATHLYPLTKVPAQSRKWDQQGASNSRIQKFGWLFDPRPWYVLWRQFSIEKYLMALNDENSVILFNLGQNCRYGRSLLFPERSAVKRISGGRKYEGKLETR